MAINNCKYVVCVGSSKINKWFVPIRLIGSSFPLNLSPNSFFFPSWTLAPFFPLPRLDLPFSSSRTPPGSCHLATIPSQTLSPPPFFKDYLSFYPLRDTDFKSNSNLFSLQQLLSFPNSPPLHEISLCRLLLPDSFWPNSPSAFLDSSK